MKSICIDCPERTPGCHSRCPDGIKEEQQSKERRERIRKARVEENEVLGHVKDVAGRIRKGNWR